MVWQTKADKEALLKFRRERRLRDELLIELKDFYEIYWSSEDHNKKTWAHHMIKAIENELSKLYA